MRTPQFVSRLTVFALALGGLSTLSCSTTTENAGAGIVPHEAAPETFAVRRSVQTPAVKALVDTFYGPGTVTSLPLLLAQAEATAQKNDAFEVHEILGALYDLKGDDVRAWRHFMKAVGDLRNDNPQYALSRAEAMWRDNRMERAEAMLLNDLYTKHDKPAVRAAAVAALSDRQWWFSGTTRPELLGALPHLTRWSLIGPFDNDQGKGFLTAYPPEMNVDLDDLPGKVIDVSWRSDPLADARGYIRLSNHIAPSKQAVAYLKTYVFAEATRPVELRFSTDAAIRVFVNERPVADVDRVDRYRFDNVIAHATLQKGWNVVLVKSANEGASWHLRARVTAPGGAPLEMVHKATKEPTPRGADAQIRVRFGDHTESGPMPRQALHLAYNLYASGQDKTALEVMRAFNQKVPDHLYAERLLVTLLRKTGEEGKAIDLVETLFSKTSGEGARFAFERIDFFTRKGRFDRALRELDALAPETQRLLEARMTRAWLFAKRGWNADACRELTAIEQDHPSLVSLHRRKAKCKAATLDPAGELRARQRVAALSPGSAKNATAEVYALVEARKYDEAGVRSREIEKRFPQRYLVLSGLAVAHRRMGDTGRASFLFERAAGLNPGAAHPHKSLGELAHLRNDTETALVHFRAAFERDPSNSGLLDRIDYYGGERDTLFYALAPTDSDIEAAIGRARKVQPVSGSNRIFILDDDVTKVARDGSTRRLVTMVQVALNKKGRDALIQQAYPRRRTKLLQAFVVQPDGSRQEASSIRSGAIRFRKVEAGSVTVVQYETSTVPRGFLPNHYAGSWYFQGARRSLVNGRWVVILDDERPIHVQIDGPLKHDTRTQDGRAIHTFIGENIGPIVPEPMMPPIADLVAKVSISTVSDWDEYVRWERALLRDAFESNAELKAIAKRLTEGATSERERFDRLYRYVADEIRYQQDYENTIAGVRPHACPVVLERGYGDCKDKAVLLILLAEHAGLDVDFAILRTRPAGAVLRDVPNQQFNHAIVYVPKQGDIAEGFFMDPTTDGVDIGSLRSDDQGAYSLVLDPKTGNHHFEQIPFQPPEYEQMQNLLEIVVDENAQASANVTLTARGNLGGGFRRALREKEAARRMMEQTASAMFPGSTLTAVQLPDDAPDITKPVTFAFAADVKSALTETPKGTRLSLPRLILPFQGAVQTNSRDYPVRFSIPAQLEQSMTITLPKGSLIEESPEPLKVEHPCFSATRTVKKASSSSIALRYTFEQRCDEVSTEMYPAFRAAAVEVLKQRENTIVFRTAGSTL